MFRVVSMPSKFYAMKVDLDTDIENIKAFIDSGETVILCDSLTDLEELGIHIDEIEAVILQTI